MVKKMVVEFIFGWMGESILVSFRMVSKLVRVN